MTYARKENAMRVRCGLSQLERFLYCFSRDFFTGTIHDYRKIYIVYRAFGLTDPRLIFYNRVELHIGQS